MQRFATPGRILVLALSLALAGALHLPAQPRPALALDNGLALTPYMGWNSYYGQTPLYEAFVLSVARAIVARGLLAAGYNYVWLDATWWDGTRDDSGNIVPPPRQWPHGLRFLTDYIHSLGLRAGIYTDAGADGCAGPGQGSGPGAPGGPDHYQQDADRFASWGFDAVKVDFCGGKTAGLDSATQFQQFGAALAHNASGRPILYNICNPFTPQLDGVSLQDSAYWAFTYGPGIANSWRTSRDIALPGRQPPLSWADMMTNLETNSVHPEAAGPGHWNDPDYLAPELGMSPTEDRTQITMWSMLAAPLMVGSDVRTLSDATVAALTNPEVIAIDQDPLGRQAVKVQAAGGVEIWVKQLASRGALAVTVLNTNADTRSATVNWSDVGATGSAAVRDLWAHTDLGVFPAGVKLSVQGHGAVLLRVRAAS
jgi:alpha-galactosidase